MECTTIVINTLFVLHSLVFIIQVSPIKTQNPSNEEEGEGGNKNGLMRQFVSRLPSKTFHEQRNNGIMDASKQLQTSAHCTQTKSVYSNRSLAGKREDILRIVSSHSGVSFSHRKVIEHTDKQTRGIFQRPLIE